MVSFIQQYILFLLIIPVVFFLAYGIGRMMGVGIKKSLSGKGETKR